MLLPCSLGIIRIFHNILSGTRVTFFLLLVELAVEEAFPVDHLDALDNVNQCQICLVLELIQHDLSTDSVLKLTLNYSQAIARFFFTPLYKVALGVA